MKENNKLNINNLQVHYFTKDDRFYTTKEIANRPLSDGEWIPYKEYIRVLIQLVKLKNKNINARGKDEHIQRPRAKNN